MELDGMESHAKRGQVGQSLKDVMKFPEASIGNSINGTWKLHLKQPPANLLQLLGKAMDKEPRLVKTWPGSRTLYSGTKLKQNLEGNPRIIVDY